MEYILIGSVFFLCCTILFLRWYSRISERNLSQTTRNDTERKFGFIRDVCDGHLQKAEALLFEKCAIDKTLSYEQAVDQVYIEMLDLTADERGAGESKSKSA
jgi:hypothetical protein